MVLSNQQAPLLDAGWPSPVEDDATSSASNVVAVRQNLAKRTQGWAASLTLGLCLVGSLGAPAIVNAQTTGTVTPTPATVAEPSQQELSLATRTAELGEDPADGVLLATAEREASRGRGFVTVSKASVLVGSLTVFLLAVFVGFEIITKVPPTLHTPLMSGSNAISGITVVGAMLAAGAKLGGFGSLLGLLAVVLATVNVVGGFLVTHRMLMMFKKR